MKKMNLIVVIALIGAIILSACGAEATPSDAQIQSAASTMLAQTQAANGAQQLPSSTPAPSKTPTATLIPASPSKAPTATSTAINTSTAPASVLTTSCGDAVIADTKFQGTEDKPILTDGNFGDQWTWVIIRAVDVNGIADPFWGFVEIKYYADLMIDRMAVTAYNIKATNRDDAICMAYQMADGETIVYFGNNTPKNMTNTAPAGWSTTVKPYPNMEDIWAGNGNYTSFDILIGGDNHDFTCATTDYCYMQEWKPSTEGEAWHTIIWPGYRIKSPTNLQGHGGIFSNPPLNQGADPIGNFMQDSARKVILDKITKLHAQFCGPAGKAPAGWSTTMDAGFTCVAP